jgi:hypothetical protein
MLSRATVIFTVLALFCVAHSILVFGVLLYSAVLSGPLPYGLLIPGLASIFSLLGLVLLVSKLDKARNSMAEPREAKFNSLSIFFYVYAFLAAGHSAYSWYSSKFSSSYPNVHSSFGYWEIMQLGALLANPLMAVMIGYLIQAASEILTSGAPQRDSSNA